MLKKILMSIFVTLMLIYPSFALAEAIDVKNPGFEEGSNNATYWSENTWDKNAGVTTIDYNTPEHKSGSRSVCIINNSPNDARVEQQIPVKENTYYKISCWVKTENVGNDKKGANISAEAIGDTSKDIRGTNGKWEYIELYGKTNKDQKTLPLTLGLGGYGSTNTGKAWFDDVAIEQLDSAPQGVTVVNLFKSDANNNVSTPTEPAKKGGSNIGVLFLLVGLFMLGTVIYFIIKASSLKNKVEKYEPSKDSQAVEDENKKPLKFKIDRKDLLIMGGMTLIYLLIALYNLGSTNVPQTSWKPFNAGESVTVDLGKVANLSRVYYYGGLGDGTFKLEYDNGTGSFVPLTTIDKKDIFIWKYVNVTAQTSKIRITAVNAGATINEFGIFEQNSQTPLKVKIVDKQADKNDIGSIENLFDEQGTVQYVPSYMTGMYFDEIYHARTAFEHINKLEPYEWTHPPLGKLIIAVGILIFGMNPFGWRIMGTLFGAAMIPLMYMFGIKIFNKRFFAFLSAFLMMFDFMHFAQTRISTIDSYVTFFIILMYYYMYEYFSNKSYKVGLKKSLITLFLCGLFFGLGVASKWIGLYAGIGLAVIFLIAKLSEFNDYASVVNSKRARKIPWVQDFIPDHIFKTLLFCIVAFIIIPGIIYVASYIPYMMVPGHQKGLDEVITYQQRMWEYHSTGVLGSTHPFESKPLEWPYMKKPIWYYTGGDLPAGMTSSIASFGNPAIWWFGILAFFLAIGIAIYKRDKNISVIFAALLFQYVPWFFVTRLLFIYHFFSSVPFLILLIVYVLKFFDEKFKFFRYFIYAYMVIVVVLFCMFYPVLSGLVVPKEYVEHYLRWFKSKWYF